MISIFLDPGILYTFVWLFATSIYLLRYSLLLLPMSITSYFFFLSSCIAFLLPSIMGYVIKSRQDSPVSHVNKLNTQSNTKFLFRGWLALTIVEIIAAKNLPLLGIIGIGPYIRYTDFGIPSLHGLLNSCLLVLSNYAIQRYLVLKDRKYLIEFFFYLAWSISILGRQLMLSQVVQSIFILIYHKSFSIPDINVDPAKKLISRFSNIVKFTFVVITFITLFGIIGDSRQQSDLGGILEIAQVSPSFPSFLPSSVFWVYLYITSPLSNTIYNIGDNIGNIKPSYLPFSTLATIIPSQIRDPIMNQFTDGLYEWELVVEFLNVSSFHQSFLLDFGVLGSIVLYFLISLLSQNFYQKSRLSSWVCWRFMNIVILHNIIFSVFNSFFTNLVFVGQILIHFSLQYKSSKLQKYTVPLKSD
jgi:oligosaccharide repeat unit polymerase